jgi:hypothetical protein
MTSEIQKLGRTLPAWFDKIANFHWPGSPTGRPKPQQPDQAQRIGFKFRNFENYRIRALLYAGKLNWRVRGSIGVR